nr:NUDIX hydrolase [Bifidobacterium vespertilionis]
MDSKANESGTITSGATPAVPNARPAATHPGEEHPGDPMLDWAIELQSLAQAGLAYCTSPYDQERYERIRSIAAQMLAVRSDLPLTKVKDLFCNEIGYQTPKLDTRAAIFEDDRILLVRENDGTWSLPGGWVDVNQSVRENTIKEAKEESGLDVTADRVIAIQDRAKHNLPPYAYGICKIFVLCTRIGGHFEANIETTEARYFAEDDLPALAEAKNNAEQIAMCFAAHRDPDWITLFE